MTSDPSPATPAADQPPKKTADMAAYRKAYRAAYRQDHHRPTLTLNAKEHAAFARQAARTGRTLPAEIKALATAQLSGKPVVEPDPKKLDDAVFLLRNIANNINQIARRLNLESRRHREKVVRDEESSSAILKAIFTDLRAMEKNFPGLTNSPPSP